LAATSAGSLRTWWFAVTVLLALGAASAVVYALLIRDSTDSLGAAPASTVEGNEWGEGSTEFAGDDGELASGAGISESTREEWRARQERRERDRAEQHRLGAQKSAQGRAEAEREAREAARRAQREAEREAEQQRRDFEIAKRRVQITMYMADW
jgi:hypothetical protein